MHSNAYMEAGLGELPIMDLFYIALTPNIEDLTSKEGRKQIGEVFRQLKDYWKERPSVLFTRMIEFCLYRDQIKNEINKYSNEQSTRLFFKILAKELELLFKTLNPNITINVIYNP